MAVVVGSLSGVKGDSSGVIEVAGDLSRVGVVMDLSGVAVGKSWMGSSMGAVAVESSWVG